MHRIRTIIQRTTLYFTALLLVAGYPFIAMAETPEATVADPTTTSTQTQPAPAPEAPKPTYTYNPVTGYWDSTKWKFNPATGAYEPVVAPTVITVPDAPATMLTNDAGSIDAKTTLPSDQSSIEALTKVTSAVNATNQLQADATSGNALVLKNTVAGGATTGDVASTATILNNVNSVIAAGDNAKVANFTYDVMGDVKGDIMLYPMLLKTMLEAGASPNISNSIMANQTNQLSNEVNLNATSGNAAVQSNTVAGNATTGSANTVANIMNILNSMISANRSFIGTINIYGSLEGDLLVAPDFIPQMIANNKTIPTATSGVSAVKSTDTQTIINNVALAAQSGSAAVLGNTAAGNATTGSADTNVVIFNLSGHAIVAKNSLLVFVNVLGKWVGVIVDAPTGATSALLGNGVVSDITTQPDLAVTAKTTNVITNNVILTSRSGDALVAGNTQAGNATSGKATASANIANISGSQLGISDWFGVLFINVFGNWYGSFGVNTSYGDAPVATNGGTSAAQLGVIEFAPRQGGGAVTKVHRMTVIDSRQLAMTDTAPDGTAVLGATTTNTGAGQIPTKTTASEPFAGIQFDYRLPIAAASLLVVGLSAVGLRRFLGVHEKV